MVWDFVRIVPFDLSRLPRLVIPVVRIGVLSMDGFKCQQCDAPLRIDTSLIDLSPAQQTLLMGKLLPPEAVELNPADYISPSRLALYEKTRKRAMYESLSDGSDSEAQSEQHGQEHADPSRLSSVHSFVVLPANSPDTMDASAQLPQTISQRVATLEHVLKILSANQTVDHPLCEECATLLVDNFKRKYDQVSREKDSYLAFLRKLRALEDAFGHGEEDARLAATKLERSRQHDEEATLLAQLQQLEHERTALDAELAQAQAQHDALVEGPLAEVLRTRNANELELARRRNELAQSRAAYSTHLDRLDRLRAFNIHRELFTITFDHQYGTINGLRLGYRVPWAENNAALGQVVLLLMYLLRRYDVEVEQYRLVPMGAQLYVVKETLDDGHGRVLELHTSNEFSLGKLFNYNKLDVSMIALLDIVTQVEARATARDPELVLPYLISAKRDTIGGKSIRVTSNAEWTTSCKFLLTNLNWLLLASA